MLDQPASLERALFDTFGATTERAQQRIAKNIGSGIVHVVRLEISQALFGYQCYTCGNLQNNTFKSHVAFFEVAFKATKKRFKT